MSRTIRSTSSLANPHETDVQSWRGTSEALFDRSRGVSSPQKLSAHTLTMTTRLLTPLLVVILAILFGLYQIRLKPLLEVGGFWKEAQDVGGKLKETCIYVDDLKGCERKPIFWSLKSKHFNFV
jgi:hypothetical protein